MCVDAALFASSMIFRVNSDSMKIINRYLLLPAFRLANDSRRDTIVFGWQLECFDSERLPDQFNKSPKSRDEQKTSMLKKTTARETRNKFVSFFISCWICVADDHSTLYSVQGFSIAGPLPTTTVLLMWVSNGEAFQLNTNFVIK